jgi:ribose transport system substrate-binding protein
MNDLANSSGVGARRRSVLLTGAGLAAAAVAMPWVRRVSAADVPTVVNSIRSLTNPYHATWNKGGEAFAKAMGAPYTTLVTEGNSEKCVADVRAMLAKTGGNMVLNVDPNDSPDARPIVEACHKAGAYVVTQWNKPADLHPWDFDPNYVAHISFSGVPNGKAMAEALFKAMGGEGGIVALGGILSNIPAIERKRGLDQAWPRTRRSSCSTSRSPTGSRPRRSRRPTPGSPSSATRSRASGPPTTTWRSAPSRPCAPTAAPARSP